MLVLVIPFPPCSPTRSSRFATRLVRGQVDQSRQPPPRRRPCLPAAEVTPWSTVLHSGSTVAADARPNRRRSARLGRSAACQNINTRIRFRVPRALQDRLYIWPALRLKRTGGLARRFRGMGRGSPALGSVQVDETERSGRQNGTIFFMPRVGRNRRLRGWSDVRPPRHDRLRRPEVRRVEQSDDTPADRDPAKISSSGVGQDSWSGSLSADARIPSDR